MPMEKTQRLLANEGVTFANAVSFAVFSEMLLNAYLRMVLVFYIVHLVADLLSVKGIVAQRSVCS